MNPLQTISILLTLASVTVLAIGGAGCSPDPQGTQRADKKIDLTLPKPGARLPAAQKPAEKTQAAAQKNDVDATSAAVERDLSDPAASKPSAAPARAVKSKKKTADSVGEKRDAAAISPPQPDTGAKGGEARGNAIVTKEQAAAPNAPAEPYQPSDNPLHPSYKKK